MKKASVFNRTFLLAAGSILATLPYILYFHGSLLFPLIGLAALCLIHAVTAAFRHDQEDSTQKDREKAVTKLLSSPFYILRSGSGGGAPSTPTDYSLSPKMRYSLCAWLVAAAVQLVSAIVIEDAIGGGFGKFYPVWLAVSVLAVIDLVMTFRESSRT